MSEKLPKVGTWDAMADAVDILNKGGLAFVLTVGMENSRIARSRTNATVLDSLEWLESRHEENMKLMRDQYE